MSDNYVGNVLNILRLMKASGLQNGSPETIRQWMGVPTGVDPQIGRVAAYIIEQAKGAATLIEQSPLPDEAKAGLLQTTNAVAQAFAFQSVQNPLQQFIPQIDTALSSFAILAGVINSTPVTSPPELGELIASVKAVQAEFEAANIDPIVAETAKRHLAVLLMMLTHIEAFGVDAALTAYFEMVARLKRTTDASTPSAKDRVAAIWPEIERWAGRLAIIDQAINHGASLLTQFEAVPHLLQYVPSVTGG